MTSRNSLKRRIRARMSRTGESYSTARARVLAAGTLAGTPDLAASLTIALAQPPARSGDLAQDLAGLLAEGPVPQCDVLVLPELIGGHSAPSDYERVIAALARKHRCHVVGGSCYAATTAGTVNRGIVMAADGHKVASYEKSRPYGSENQTGIAAGSAVGSFEVAGRTITVLICSDLWFSENVSSLSPHPDVLLIPSFSITQREEPGKARRLWEHMLVSRAYEYSAYVGVCDWAHPCEFEGLPAAGVSGFADPRPNGEHFFAANLDQAFRAYELDFERLDAFRENRANRGFSSRAPAPA